MSLKNGVLEGSRLDFGSPGARFWRVWSSFSKVLAVINGAKNVKKRQLRESPVLIPGTAGGQKCYSKFRESSVPLTASSGGHKCYSNFRDSSVPITTTPGGQEWYSIFRSEFGIYFGRVSS